MKITKLNQRHILIGASLFLLLAGSSGCVYGKHGMQTIDAHHLSGGGSIADAQEKPQDIVSSPAGGAGDETIVPSTPAPTETPPPPPPSPTPPPPPPPPVVDPGCKMDSDCTNGEKCDTSDGECVGCLTNTDCSNGQTCDTGKHQCVAPWVPPYTPEPGYCSSDQECISAHGAGWTCSEDRLCQAAGPLTIVSHYPDSTDTVQNPNLEITFTFNKPMDLASVANAFSVREVANGQPYDYYPDLAPQGQVTTKDNTTFTFKAAAPYLTKQQYQYWITGGPDGVKALDGTTTSTFSTTFTVQELPPLDLSCVNGVHDLTEGDVDCGGSCSAKCTTYQFCNVDSDCESGVCVPGIYGTPALCQ
jgi:Cys-rich repeat protein